MTAEPPAQAATQTQTQTQTQAQVTAQASPHAGAPRCEREVVSRFVEGLAQVFVDSGMPRIASRILAALLATDAGRLTARELSEHLLASPAAISGGVRYLIHVDLVSRERDPGSRRDHYRVDGDVWYRSITQRDQLLARWVANLRDGAGLLGGDTPAGARFAESAAFLEFVRDELHGISGRWEAHRSARRPQLGDPQLGDPQLRDPQRRTASGPDPAQ